MNPETIACAKETGINVELAKMARSRIVISAEPDKRNQWSAAAIKKIAGKGKVTGGRGLYSDKTNFHRTFVAFVLCNDMPGIADNDAAVTDRFRVLKYPYTFSSAAEGHAPPGERAANSRVADLGIVRLIKTEHASGLLKKFTLMCATNHGGAPAVLPCGFRDHTPMPMSVESDSKVKANGWAAELQDEIGDDPRFGESVDAPWVDAECGLRAIKVAIKGKLKVITNASAIKEKDFEAAMAEMGWQKETNGVRRDPTTLMRGWYKTKAGARVWLSFEE